MHVFRYTTNQRIDILERPTRHVTVMGNLLEKLQEQAILSFLGSRIKIQEVITPEEIEKFPEGETLLLSDNLFLTPEFLHSFLATARKQQINQIYCAAISTSTQIVSDFVQPLSSCPITGDLLLLGLFYARTTQPGIPINLSIAKPIPIDLLDEPLEQLALPPLSTQNTGDRQIVFEPINIVPATDFAPLRINTSTRLALPIEHWVHLLTANIPFGIYSDAIRFRDGADLLFYPWSSNRELPNNIRDLVIISEGCQIDPSATIIGPTFLGKNVRIGPGATIVASVLGNNCVVGQGNHVRLSVFEDGVILPPATNIMLWSFLGRGSLVNSQMRFSVVGEDCFIGAVTCITDRILDNSPSEKDTLFGGRQVKVKFRGSVIPSGYWILGAAIGNRTKTASGTILYPGRELPPDSLIHLQTGDDLPLIPIT